ncbi:hypothetical protein SDC9_192301 [bioreactor metagenome]|uniref:Uncharacterized protein n=1 Tax=bioreactor metagenome TaxID=1076179 RepID=A0A645I1L7_9ZZZZ
MIGLYVVSPGIPVVGDTSVGSVFVGSGVAEGASVADVICVGAAEGSSAGFAQAVKTPHTMTAANMIVKIFFIKNLPFFKFTCQSLYHIIYFCKIPLIFF